MYFRPLADADLAAGPSWLGEVELRADRWRDAHTRSIVLEEDGVLLAAGILWTSRVHDDRYWAAIVVDPARRREGIGRGVFERLAELRAAPLPFITRGFVGSPELAFADALGARTIQVVPPARIEVEHRSALRPLPGALPGTAVPLERLGAATARMYAWIHASWSPVAPGFATPLLEGFADEVDAEASAVVLDAEGEVRAIAVVYRDDPPVLIAESAAPDDPEGERLVEGCVRAALDVLATRGIERVEFDGHVTDPHFLPVWARLEPTGRWFRLVEVVPWSS